MTNLQQRRHVHVATTSASTTRRVQPAQLADRRAKACKTKSGTAFDLPEDGAANKRCFYVIALIGAPLKHAGVFHLRDGGLLRRRAGYLLPKAGAVMTCAQPNLVRHGIYIALTLMFYYVTDYEYYITGPQTMSVKTEERPP